MIGVPSEPFVPAPAAYPPSTENLPVRRRAVFSSSVDGLESHHALPANASGQHQRRRKTEDDSLRLIDDLTNRPMDPLFTDARLTHHPTSALELWATRLIVFVICVAVGFAGCLFVQRLHTDPRKAVRQSWSSELQDLNKQVDQLTADVSDLQSQVAKRSKQLGDVTQSDQLTEDNMVNGLVPVTGEGITLTIANPIAADDSGDGTYHRENSGQQIRLVTDADLQMMVSLLWKAGAEAISINGYRLGVQTSIRTAGQTIMVGVNPVQSPYAIEAIGNRNDLADTIGSDRQPQLYESFKEAGIYPQVSKSASITLEAAAASNLSYARKDE
ncbi:MAG: DUF881 domain-containing protein [Bifidobacterium scardovii]|nr:DUF881 domain-containing protein [Bifidobacterium scardovii]